MPGPQPKNTWVLVVGVLSVLLLVSAVVALGDVSTPVDALIRFGALTGYSMVFLTALASNYMRELTRFFGRRFVKVHHVAAVTALIALTLHATGVVWRTGSLSALLPKFSSLRLFLTLGGPPALLLIAVASLTALLRASIGKNWKALHWLNYIAFLLGTIHAQLIGRDFQYLAVRIVSGAMAVALVAVFVLKRRAEARRKQKPRARA